MLAAVSRTVGVVPMLLLGWWGTLIPKPVRMTVAMGRPVRVETNADPSESEVRVHLDAFIAEMERIVEAHKAEAGHPDLSFTVY